MSVEKVDVPLCQRALSKMIDSANFNSLLISAPDTHAWTLEMSSALPHAEDWVKVVKSLALELHLPDKELSFA